MRRIRQHYDEHSTAHLLIVGHTDTTADDAYNETLSVERAASILAYLRDDVDAWLQWYEPSAPDRKRWGSAEDLGMLQSLCWYDGLTLSANPILSFQRWHNSNIVGSNPKALPLAEDGMIGPQTRRQLVLDYMSHDGTSLPPSIRPVVHGCGEYFPLDDRGTELDPSALNNKRDRADRRVELFFFDGVAGVQPPPTGPISKRGTYEYPTWRNRSALDVNVPLEPLEGLIGVRLPTRFAKSSDFPKPTIIQTPQVGIFSTKQRQGMPCGTPAHRCRLRSSRRIQRSGVPYHAQPSPILCE